MKPTIYFLAIQRAIQAIRAISKFKPAELNEQEQAKLTELKNLLKEPEPTRQFFAYLETVVERDGSFISSTKWGTVSTLDDMGKISDWLKEWVAKELNITKDKIVLKSFSII